MIRVFRFYTRLISIQIRSQMQYRVSFLMDLVSTAALSGISFLAVALIIERFGSIMGWTLGEVAFLAGLIEMSFAVMEILFSGFEPDVFSTQIRQGSFDQMLLRPVNITVQVLGSRFLMRRLGRFIGRPVDFYLLAGNQPAGLDGRETGVPAGRFRQPGGRVWGAVYDGLGADLLDHSAGRSRQHFNVWWQ